MSEETVLVPVSLRGANCGNIYFDEQDLTRCEDAIDANFAGCRFQRLYIRHSILGEYMLHEKIYEWAIQKLPVNRFHLNLRSFYILVNRIFPGSLRINYNLETLDELTYLRMLGIENVSDLTFTSTLKPLATASAIYLNLKANWQDIGYNDDASWAARCEKECERKAAFALLKAALRKELTQTELMTHSEGRQVTIRLFVREKAIKWVMNSFLNFLCKYGESYWRVIFWAVSMIILCAFLYPITGINATIGTNPDKQLLGYTLNTSFGETIFNAGRFLYYSVVTFTTVGYGDFHPVGTISHIVAMIEAFFGVFLIGLFIWCLGRRVGAR